MCVQAEPSAQQPLLGGCEKAVVGSNCRIPWNWYVEVHHREADPKVWVTGRGLDRFVTTLVAPEVKTSINVSTRPDERRSRLGDRQIDADFSSSFAQTVASAYDTASGALLHTWKVPKRVEFLDAASGIAVFTVACKSGLCPGRVYVTRLADGKTVQLAPTKRELAGLEIDAAGIVYANHLGRTIVFYPVRR